MAMKYRPGCPCCPDEGICCKFDSSDSFGNAEFTSIDNDLNSSCLLPSSIAPGCNTSTPYWPLDNASEVQFKLYNASGSSGVSDWWTFNWELLNTTGTKGIICNINFSIAGYEFQHSDLPIYHSGSPNFHKLWPKYCYKFDWTLKIPNQADVVFSNYHFRVGFTEPVGSTAGYSLINQPGNPVTPQNDGIYDIDFSALFQDDILQLVVNYLPRNAVNATHPFALDTGWAAPDGSAASQTNGVLPMTFPWVDNADEDFRLKITNTCSDTLPLESLSWCKVKGEDPDAAATCYGDQTSPQRNQNCQRRWYLGRELGDPAVKATQISSVPTVSGITLKPISYKGRAVAGTSPVADYPSAAFQTVLYPNTYFGQFYNLVGGLHTGCVEEVSTNLEEDELLQNGFRHLPHASWGSPSFGEQAVKTNFLGTCFVDYTYPTIADQVLHTTPIFKNNEFPWKATINLVRVIGTDTARLKVDFSVFYWEYSQFGLGLDVQSVEDNLYHICDAASPDYPTTQIDRYQSQTPKPIATVRGDAFGTNAKQATASWDTVISICPLPTSVALSNPTTATAPVEAITNFRFIRTNTFKNGARNHSYQINDCDCSVNGFFGTSGSHGTIQFRIKTEADFDSANPTEMVDKTTIDMSTAALTVNFVTSPWS